jgi:DNA-binding CsgD family transcriptional regulator
VPPHGPKPPSSGGESAKKLSTTERVILRALRDKLTLSEIAVQLQRSELTVRTHIRNARAKLEIRGTAELRRMLAAGDLTLSHTISPTLYRGQRVAENLDGGSFTQKQPCSKELYEGLRPPISRWHQHLSVRKRAVRNGHAERRTARCDGRRSRPHEGRCGMFRFPFFFVMVLIDDIMQINDIPASSLTKARSASGACSAC